MSAQTNDNGVMKAILESANASNALAIANTFYVDVMKKANNELDGVRQAEEFAMTTAINFGYAVAKAVLMQSLVQASLDIGSAAGQYSALRGANTEQSSLNELEQKEQPNLNTLKTEEEKINSRLKTATDENDKGSISEEKQNLKINKAKQDKKNKSIEKKQAKVSQKFQKANMASNILQAFTQGANAIPQAQQKVTEQVGSSVQSIIQQLQSMLESSYNKIAQTLRGFLDIDYLSGLVAIGSMQLR